MVDKRFKQIIGVFGFWLLLSVAIKLLNPFGYGWFWWVPLAFIVLAFLITAIIICIRMIVPPITEVRVGKIPVKACMFCPSANIKNNPVNPDFPVVKCMETARICYMPKKIPRWCPYAK
jgi:hypothetical protein